MTKITLLTYWQHAKKYPGYMFGLFTSLPLTLLVHQFLPPLVAASVLDRLSNQDYVKDDLWGSFGGELLTYVFLLMLGGVAMWRIVIYFVWKMESYVTRDLARTQFNRLMNLSSEFHNNSFGGSLVSQTNKLTGSYARLADTLIFQVYSLLISLVLASVILWSRAPQFVIVLIIFTIIFVLISVKITKPIRNYVVAEAKAQNAQTGVLADAITNIMAVKSFAAIPQEQKRFREATEFTRGKTVALMWTSLKREAFIGTITSGVEGTALILAAASVVVFDAQIGTVFLVLQYTATITHRLWEFSLNGLKNFNRVLGDAKDGMEMLQLPDDVNDPKKPEPLRIKKGGIEFKSVAFKHNDSNNTDLLFDNLQINIKSGEKIGLVGHSGSGKTTLTKLLLRFSDINSGAIEIDGQNIANITQSDLRSNVAYVPQEPLLFHRSIAENISYGSDSASTEQMFKAAKNANADEFIKTLADGYDTLVGERGVKLSGGQRQRVAIARAMIKDSPILVLDEATSALDSESEQLIQDALWKLMQGRTAIVIAHRLSTIQKMDRILVMENGEIIEEGSHAELVENKGKYSELWAHQSGGFLEE